MQKKVHVSALQVGFKKGFLLKNPRNVKFRFFQTDDRQRYLQVLKSSVPHNTFSLAFTPAATATPATTTAWTTTSAFAFLW